MKRPKEHMMQFPAARRFTNRTQEIQAVTQSVQALMKNVNVQKCLINIYGVPGIGKTALFAALESMHHGIDQLLLIALDLARIDAEPALDLLTHKRRFLQLFWEQLPTSLKGTRERAEGIDLATEAQLNTILKDYSVSLRRLGKPVLMLVDAWETVSEDIFSWFEQVVLFPLVLEMPCPCICVLGSQQQLRWRKPDVRRRVRAYPLTALNLLATQEQMHLEDDSELGRLIFKMTAGHPYASEVVFAQLQEGSRTHQWLYHHRCMVAQAVVDALHGRTRYPITDELQRILEVIALFREFEIATLRLVVAQFVPNLQSYSESVLIVLLKQLLETQFVTWNDEIRSYQLDSSVRNVVAHTVEVHNLERFRNIHHAAMKYYHDLIPSAPGNRHVYLTEFYYHGLYKGDATFSSVEELSRTFETLLMRHYMNHDGSLANRALLERLRNHLADEELYSTFAAQNLPPMLLIDILDQKLASSSSDHCEL